MLEDGESPRPYNPQSPQTAQRPAHHRPSTGDPTRPKRGVPLCVADRGGGGRERSSTVPVSTPPQTLNHGKERLIEASRPLHCSINIRGGEWGSGALPSEALMLSISVESVCEGVALLTKTSGPWPGSFPESLLEVDRVCSSPLAPIVLTARQGCPSKDLGVG